MTEIDKWFKETKEILKDNKFILYELYLLSDYEKLFFFIEDIKHRWAKTGEDMENKHYDFIHKNNLVYIRFQYYGNIDPYKREMILQLGNKYIDCFDI